MCLFISCSIHSIKMMDAVLNGSYSSDVLGGNKFLHRIRQSSYKKIFSEQIEQLFVNGIGIGFRSA